MSTLAATDTSMHGFDDTPRTGVQSFDPVRVPPPSRTHSLGSLAWQLADSRQVCSTNYVFAHVPCLCRKRTCTCVPAAIHTLQNVCIASGRNVHVRFQHSTGGA
jgi:hypothetical protein